MPSVLPSTAFEALVNPGTNVLLSVAGWFNARSEDPEAAEGTTVKPNSLLTPAYDAVSVTGVADTTLPASTKNVAVVDPCGTVTAEGTLAAVVELESDTSAPPLPAGPERVTVPVADCALTIVVAFTESRVGVMAGGLTVIENVELEPE